MILLDQNAFNKSSENSLEASELYNECDYEFCCNDCFIKDYEVGKIYSDVSRYLNYEQDALTYENLVINISAFLQDNSDENFYDEAGLPASACNPPYGFPLYYKRATQIGIPTEGANSIHDAAANYRRRKNKEFEE